MRMLAGVLAPDAGSDTINGADLLTNRAKPSRQSAICPTSPRSIVN
ncbi:MAG: hypothetical protein R3F44_01305 [Candidatus Competibacteraceae bacterium]